MFVLCPDLTGSLFTVLCASPPQHLEALSLPKSSTYIFFSRAVLQLLELAFARMRGKPEVLGICLPGTALIR